MKSTILLALSAAAFADRTYHSPVYHSDTNADVKRVLQERLLIDADIDADVDVNSVKRGEPDSSLYHNALVDRRSPQNDGSDGVDIFVDIDANVNIKRNTLSEHSYHKTLVERSPGDASGISVNTNGNINVVADVKRDLLFRTEFKSVGMQKSKRDLLTCEESYGGGSIVCGDNTSHNCYDPSKGEICCLLDNGYCNRGQSCAPVAGWCCGDTEDPRSCANRLQFTLPSSFFTNIPIITATSDLFPGIPTSFAEYPTITALASDFDHIETAFASWSPLSFSTSVFDDVTGILDSVLSTQTPLQTDFTAPTATPSEVVNGSFTGSAAGGSTNAVPFTGAAISVKIEMLACASIAGALILGMLGL